MVPGRLVPHKNIIFKTIIKYFMASHVFFVDAIKMPVENLCSMIYTVLGKHSSLFINQFLSPARCLILS